MKNALLAAAVLALIFAIGFGFSFVGPLLSEWALELP